MRYYLRENIRLFLPDGVLYNEDNEVVYRYENVTFFLPQINIYKNNTKVGHIKRVFTWFLRSYDVYYNDSLIDTISQNFTFLRSKLTLGRDWKIKGNIFSWAYEIYDEDDKLIARVNQELFRLHRRFFVDIIDEDREEIIILLVIAINQFDREKSQQVTIRTSSR